MCKETQYFKFFAHILESPTIKYNKFEDCTEVDTDTDRILMIWPIVEKRDVEVNFVGDELEFVVTVEPMSYVFNFR